MKSDDGAMRVRTTEQKGINVKGLDRRTENRI